MPKDIVYADIDTLSAEARQKLDEIRPLSLGQASRISGVSPADITALLILLEQHNRGISDMFGSELQSALTAWDFRLRRNSSANSMSFMNN